MKKAYQVIYWIRPSSTLSKTMKTNDFVIGRVMTDNPDQVFDHFTSYTGTVYLKTKKGQAIIDAMIVMAAAFDPKNPDRFSIENVVVYDKRGMFDRSQGEEWDNRREPV